MAEKPIPSRKPWSREELILAMNLYCRIPFGRQHSRAPEVIELARALGRTPGSVAMKLNNFTSLDPEEAARGVRGLPGAGKLDRMVWEEFHADWERMAGASEALWRLRVEKRIEDSFVGIESSEDSDISHDDVITDKNPHECGTTNNDPHERGSTNEARIVEISAPRSEPSGPTEGERVVWVRLAQNFFRRAVLTAYGIRCCVSGNPVPELLIASHILPWSQFPEHRINPRNGLCLSRLHDAAFDQGLITFDEDNRLVLSRSLKDYLPNDSLQQDFVAYEGHRIQMPEKFTPSPEFLLRHRQNIYRG